MHELIKMGLGQITNDHMKIQLLQFPEELEKIGLLQVTEEDPVIGHLQVMTLTTEHVVIKHTINLETCSMMWRMRRPRTALSH